MSTSTTTPEPTAFPYNVANSAEAAKLFFAERVHVSDPNMGNNTSTPEMHERLCDIVASFIADRLCAFWKCMPYSENEEIEFVFKKIGDNSDSPSLTSPLPLVKDLEYRFRGVGIYLKGWTGGLAANGTGVYVLRVSPRLVTFGGSVVWQASAE